MKKINLLIIPTGGLLKDGIVLSQLDYIRKMNKKKFNISIVCSNNPIKDLNDEFEKNGCNVIYLPNRKKNVFKYILAFTKVLKSNKYDIVHVHGSSSIMAIELLIAKFNNVPVRIAHSRNTLCKHKIVDRILRPIFYNSFNYALACGTDAGKFLFNKRSFLVMHNGKDLTKYRFNSKIRKEIRNKYNLNGKTVFGHVGTMNEQKNHTFLINLFKSYNNINPNSVLLLIGDGMLKNSIKDLVNKLDLSDNVLFVGKVNNVNDFYQAIDIMLLPSLYEGLPNVVLEWQASGVPSIISDTVTQECKMYDETFYLPINNGVEEWQNKIDEIIDLKINREKLSNIGCQKLIEAGFELESNTKKLEKIYIDLVNKYKKVK